MATEDGSRSAEVADRLVGGPRLTAGAVARQLGVAVTTLRTWDQRYGLGPDEHRAGRHRLYSTTDVRRLELMRRLTFQGVSPGDAAASALALAPTDLADPITRPLGSTDPTTRPPGTPVLPVGLARAAARGLSKAAASMDGVAIATQIRTCLRTYGTVLTWTEVLVPVLVGFGKRWAAGRDVVEIEHQLSWQISNELRLVAPTLATEGGTSVTPARTPAPARTLLAAAEEEQHTLALEALAAALCESRLGSQTLGARVPSEALIRAVHRTGPAVVVLWSQVPGTADPGVFARMASLGRPARLVAAGPGWAGSRLPSAVAVPKSLGEALEVVTTALGTPAGSGEASGRLSDW